MFLGLNEWMADHSCFINARLTAEIARILTEFHANYNLLIKHHSNPTLIPTKDIGEINEFHESLSVIKIHIDEKLPKLLNPSLKDNKEV